MSHLKMTHYHCKESKQISRERMGLLHLRTLWQDNSQCLGREPTLWRVEQVQRTCRSTSKTRSEIRFCRITYERWESIPQGLILCFLHQVVLILIKTLLIEIYFTKFYVSKNNTRVNSECGFETWMI